jgi:hypothetical protein
MPRHRGPEAARGEPMSTYKESAAEFIARRTEAWTNKPKRIRVKDIGREGFRIWEREAWTFMPQSAIPEEKILVVERWRYVGHEGKVARELANSTGDIQYRFSYWTRGRIGRAAGKWTFGQFAPLIPQEDLARLLKLARRDGTLLT